ncbi:9491_t:CDS:2 [Rhizophagus irregularis]|nr:9491_t:CDS:2 [Rhizophagus irregularis]
MQTNKFKTIQENINDQQQKNKDCHLSSETPTIGLTREHQFNNKEVIGEHISDMYNLTENSGLNNFKAGFVTLFNAQSIEQDSDVFISPYNDQIVEFTEETMNKLSPMINKLVEKAIQEAGGIQPNYYIVNIVMYRRMPFMSRLYLEWTFM